MLLETKNMDYILYILFQGLTKDLNIRKVTYTVQCILPNEVINNCCLNTRLIGIKAYQNLALFTINFRAIIYLSQ